MSNVSKGAHRVHDVPMATNANMSQNRNGEWRVYVCLFPGTWPEVTMGKEVPTLVQRQEALASLGFTAVPEDVFWHWTEDKEDDGSVMLIATCNVVGA